jgi:hypothetical protein
LSSSNPSGVQSRKAGLEPVSEVPITGVGRKKGRAASAAVCGGLDDQQIVAPVLKIKLRERRAEAPGKMSTRI